MTIDRARDSFAPTRDWRSVLAQQGRVTLEADVNEQAEILTESQRLETIDIIGPIGTPDNGYVVSVSGGDVQVSHGTIYVGGWRLTSTTAIATASQPGWFDMPAWPTPSGNQIIGLLVTEQTVVATEDEALREVALGGPDSAGRLRLVQHILRIPSTAGDCASAAAALPGLLAAQGLTYDPTTCALTSTATLQVSLVTPPAPGSACDPPAQGGYLGSDNQMIRVSVTDFDTGTGQGKLVWSLNNSSFLFRAVVTQNNIVTFLADPLDPDHTPQQGQAVEILRCTMDLLDGDRSYAGGGNFIAAAYGEVMVLGAAPYATATKQLTLPGNVGFNDNPIPLFVRLWESQIPFTAGTAVTLGDTGLAVTITNPMAPTPIGGRPYWHFSVRPLTPAAIYPQAFLTSPQPPSGPRQYLAPLGVVGWSSGAFQLLEDCSVPFLPLTKLHDCSCCSLVLDPDKDWFSTLTLAAADKSVTSLNVCFQPGAFAVPTTIVITGKTVRMTGAGGGTILTGAGLEVVLELDQCPDVDISDLCITAKTTGYSPANGTKNLQGAVTIRGCQQVDIERVTLACADNDLRSASCLAVYNPVPPFNANPQQYNLRVLNSQFNVGHFQVGILVVNADRAQIEGNLVVTPPVQRGITVNGLSQHKAVAFRLRKQLIEGMTLINTAPPTSKKARARLRKRQAVAAASRSVSIPVAQQADVASVSGAQQASAPAAQGQVRAAAVQARTQRLDLGALGKAHVRANFGTVHVQFISSDKLGNAWNDAIRASGLSENATMGAVHQTIKSIAHDAVFNVSKVAPAFGNWVASTLPLLYSTAGQGIVVGGDIANDVRIINNTIDGTAQGIHVGLSDIKKNGKGSAHLSAKRVQIRGNTVNIRLTPENTGDRHGIFLGCVKSATVQENHLQLTRFPPHQGGGLIDAIKVAGVFGPLLTIERNCMLGFNQGVYFVSDVAEPSGSVWITSENYAG